MMLWLPKEVLHENVHETYLKDLKLLSYQKILFIFSSFLICFKDKNTDITVKDNTDDFCLRDTLSIASTDSFVSTAEVRLLKIDLERLMGLFE